MTIALEAVSVGYAVAGRRLVADASLRLERGSVLALVGPNGAGKSTLLRLLGGELEPSEGDVRMLGRRLTDWSARERARLRAVMPQQTVLQFAFTAAEVVAMGRHPHGQNGGAAVERAMEATEISGLAGRSFPTLSAGEQSRVTLARVLAQEPEVFLLDEPTSALDVRHQELAMRLARRLAGRGKAVLAVLHDLNLAAAYADAVALLKDGRVVAVGAPWGVLTTEVLLEVFEHPVVVVPHPERDCPLVVSAAHG